MAENNSENRRKVRILAVDELISASLQPVGKPSEGIFGFVVDMSAHGFQISIPEKIPVGTIIELSITRQSDDDLWETEHFQANVRWCRQDELMEDSFNVGVEILGSTER